MSKKDKDIIHMTISVKYNLKSGSINIEELNETEDIDVVLSFTPSYIDERLIESLDVEDMEYLQDCYEPSVN